MADNDTRPFILSIEDYEGHSFRHGFHLGTGEALARALAAERYEARIKAGLPTITVALIRGDTLWDTYMGGKWASEY